MGDSNMSYDSLPGFCSARENNRSNSRHFGYNEIEDPSSTIPGSKDSATVTQAEENNTRSTWEPFWLSRGTLTGFACLFATLLLVSGVLHYCSEKYHGISRQKAQNYYAWKYGPTACKLTYASRP
jgi:hypothetical protein